MAANGYSRLNPPKTTIPSIGQLINKGGTSIGPASPPPDIGTVTRQGRQRNGDKKMPSVRLINRNG